MKTKTVKLDVTDIDSGKIKEAAALVDTGGLVAFPTETVYGIACRVRKDSLARLDKLKGRDSNKHYTLHIGHKDDVNKYVPKIGLRAQKLIRDTWPGPLTMVFDLDEKNIDKQRKTIEKEVFENLYENNSIGVRCPDNPVATMLLQQTNNPVIAPSANVAGDAPAIDADHVLNRFSGQIDMLLDAGPCKYKESSTVVKIGKKGLEILRLGVYSWAELETLSQVTFLFVCTGNTCRSPMAEGIFRKYLAEKLQCKVENLDKMGYKVASAGTIGSDGFPASAEAVAVCAAKGINIGDHRNKGLSKSLINESDFIFAMERVHQDIIIGLEPKAANRCLLLAGNEDIPDPMGHPQRKYETCARLIEKAIKERISELVI